MQRKKKQEAEAARAPQGLAPPAPDPRHPEAVLDTVPRAAGIDVHKMSLTCTVLVEDDSGHVAPETRQYRTYGAELRLLVGWLAGLNLARVVMESTGVFWKSVQRALSAAGVEVWVANARHVKRVPGRKTDVSDSQWLAMLARYGLVCPSFVAPPRLEELRRLTRLHARTRRVASTLRNMLHRMLDESGLRVNGHSKFPHPRSSKIPPPLVENIDEVSACGGCGQAVCGLSKALWARLRVHIAGSVHRLPSLTLPLSSA